jgi:hypothetical protein
MSRPMVTGILAPFPRNGASETPQDFLSLIKFFTCLTPVTERAVSAARSLWASVSTAPVSVTSPSNVSTEIAKPRRIDSSKSFALTFVVIVASSMTSPVLLPAGVWHANREENITVKIAALNQTRFLVILHRLSFSSLLLKCFPTSRLARKTTVPPLAQVI